jgi:hypothetical protein
MTSVNLDAKLSPATQLTWKRVAFLFFMSAFPLVTTVAAINCIIDSYGVIRSPIINRINQVKPAQWPNSRIFKPFDFLRGRYNAVILGPSREERGLDPEYRKLRDHGYSFYNFGLSELRPYEMAEITKWIARRDGNNIKTIVLGLDFLRYNVEPRSVDDYRDYYPKEGFFSWSLKQFLLRSTTIVGLPDTYNTLVASRHEDFVYHYRRGGRLELGSDSPGKGYQYKRIFAQSLSIYLNSWLSYPISRARDWEMNGFDHRELEAILDAAAESKIALVIFMEPDYALKMIALARKGLLPAVERWKKELTCVVANKRKAIPDANISLWDFNGYSEFNTEPIPEDGDQDAAMRYFWDADHYTPATGNKIFDAVLALNNLPTNDRFGVMLTPENVDEHLRRLREEQREYEASHPAALVWLRSLDQGPELVASPSLGGSGSQACHH